MTLQKYGPNVVGQMFISDNRLIKTSPGKIAAIDMSEANARRAYNNFQAANRNFREAVRNYRNRTTEFRRILMLYPWRGAAQVGWNTGVGQAHGRMITAQNRRTRAFQNLMRLSPEKNWTKTSAQLRNAAIESAHAFPWGANYLRIRSKYKKRSRSAPPAFRNREPRSPTLKRSRNY